MERRIRSIIATYVVGLLLFGSTAATAGLSGAIFTTDIGGQFVNGNVYDAAKDVYLNGGPRANQSCGAPGLPDDDYYFQVTDPSGKMLFSSDAIANRKVQVRGGLIAAYLEPESPESPIHQTSVGPCGDVTVQLLPDLGQPLDSTPGGEYKVWLTPVSRYNCCGGSFGFAPSYSKTDNFKVQAPDVPDDDGD
jgi:hypothetical protein